MSCPRSTHCPLCHAQRNQVIGELPKVGISGTPRRAWSWGPAGETGARSGAGLGRGDGVGLGERRHPRARSEPLPASGPTCPGPPGIAPRRKPSPPAPTRLKPRRKTHRNSALRFPRPPHFRRKSCPLERPRVQGFSLSVCSGTCRSASGSLVSYVAFGSILSREHPRALLILSLLLSKRDVLGACAVAKLAFHTVFGGCWVLSPIDEGCPLRVICAVRSR